MKLHLTVAALCSALLITPLYADEPKASAPAAHDNVGDGPSVERASPDPDATGKPRKTPSNPTRKVATDYAPAQDLLFSAMSLIGVKYKWGGNTPESGLDCSGFINYVFKNSLNIVLPRTALGMSNIGDTVEKDELKPGDLVFFNTLKRKFSHVGIYLGDGRFIHAPRKGRNIEVVNFEDNYWTTRYNGARRMGELGEGAIDIAAVLAGRPARQPSAATESKSCRKVSSTRKGKKITTTVCATGKTGKTKRGGKASASTKGAAKTKMSAKKPVAKKKH